MADTDLPGGFGDPHEQLESQLATFLASAPKLAMRLAHWQAANP